MLQLRAMFFPFRFNEIHGPNAAAGGICAYACMIIALNREDIPLAEETGG